MCTPCCACWSQASAAEPHGSLTPVDIRVGIKPASVTDVETPLLVVNLFEGVTEPGGATGAVDAALGGQIRRLIADGEVRGESATLTIIHNPASGLNSNGLAAQRV